MSFGHGPRRNPDCGRHPHRLVETASAMVLRGDNKISIATLCNEAQVTRSQFRANFSGKTALMAA